MSKCKAVLDSKRVTRLVVRKKPAAAKTSKKN